MAPEGEPLYEITPASEARAFGAARVRVVRAGWFRPDAGGFFGVVPKPIWSRMVTTDERGRLLCRLNLLLVEAGETRILVETGTGERMSAKDIDIKGIEGGNPAVALRAVGEDPGAIDVVVVSHLHYDHAGGMVDAAGNPLFPNARYVVQQRDADAARGHELRLQGIMEAEQLDLVNAAGQLDEVEGDVEIATDVRVVATGGHTRGSQAVVLGAPGGSARAIFFGDLVPTRWQLPVRWTSAFDDYPIDAVEARNRLLSTAVAQGWWCYFTHDPGAMPVQVATSERGAVVVREDTSA